MKPAPIQHRSKSSQKSSLATSSVAPSTVTFPTHSGHSGKGQPEKSHLAKNARYWRQRVLLRRYRFPTVSESEADLSVRIDYAGAGFFFPLGTPDAEVAVAKACQIFQSVAKQGWSAVHRRFSRELIVAFEWCTNPVLWTYTTIHTLVGETAEREADLSPANPNRQRILVVEADVGIRRALCWSVSQQPGFVSIPCNSTASFTHALEVHKPRLVLLNRNLAGPIGFKTAGIISPIQPGVPALAYSIYADGDQMFTSTPGGAAGYMVKRVMPDRLLEPILKVTGRSELITEDFLLRVKCYFQKLLQLHPDHNNQAMLKLTHREREVMELLSKGCVDKEIAQAMSISVWTVHGHIKNIFGRLRVRTRTEAVIHYLEK
jgi:DNA-binding NarL/FixJ family response regulator